MQNLRATGLMIFAMACFATADGLIKLMSQTITGGQVMFFMGIGGAILLLPLCRLNNISVLSRVFFAKTVLIRNLSEIIAAVSIFTALALAPLSTVAAILQAVPLIITLSAAIFLKETVGPRRWSAVAIGFVGVLIIIRPSTEGLDPALLLALLGAVALSVRDLSARFVPKDISTRQLSFYAFGVTGLAGALLAFLTEGFKPVSPTIAWQSLVMIGFAVGGYICVTLATRVGEISAVAPFRYTRLPFAVLVGFFLFAETPDAATLMGSALIIGSGLYVMLREAQINRQQREI